MKKNLISDGQQFQQYQQNKQSLQLFEGLCYGV